MNVSNSAPISFLEPTESHRAEVRLILERACSNMGLRRPSVIKGRGSYKGAIRVSVGCSAEQRVLLARCLRAAGFESIHALSPDGYLSLEEHWVGLALKWGHGDFAAMIAKLPASE